MIRLDGVTADWARKQVTENLRSAHNRELNDILQTIKHNVDNGKDGNSIGVPKYLIATVKAELTKRGFSLKEDSFQDRNDTDYTTTISW